MFVRGETESSVGTVRRVLGRAASPRPLLVLHLSSRLAPPSRKQKTFSLAPTSCDPP